VAISSDEQYIAAGCYDGRVYIFDKGSSTPLGSYNAGGAIRQLALSSDGWTIVAGSDDYNVYLFDGSSYPNPLWSYTTGDVVESVAISSDGKYIVAGSDDYKVYFFDKSSSTPLWSYTSGLDMYSVAISSDGQYIVAGSYDKKVYLFENLHINTFISVWDTTRTSGGSSGSNQVHLPLESSGTYDFVVNWGDGTSYMITNWNQPAVTHTYATSGVYMIKITGTIVGWRFYNGGDRLKILEIQQWGCLQLGNLENYFEGCENLVLTATDNLNLTGTTSLYRTFYGCSSLGSSGNMNGWDVSSVTNMRWMFHGASSFNQPIGNWDVESVTHMEYMFNSATSFNQPLGGWDVSSVTHMEYMFSSATSFNQPLGNWVVSSVTNMSWMFHGASSFNRPIGNWDVASVTHMENMFNSATSFNQPLGGWDVSSVINMNWMFQGVTLSTPNYDNLLLGWSQLTLQAGVTFHAGNSKYSSIAADARQAIIDNFVWTIIDGGIDPMSGAFTLSSDAGIPDTNGLFTLSWTNSYGVANYSVYSYSGYITEINESVTILAEGITNLNLPLSGY
jgi:surface protein